MEFRILGPVQVFDGEPLPINGPRRVSLLARLLLEAGDVVPRDRLIEAVWEDGATPTAATVHSHVSQLRKLLGPDRLVHERDGYRLSVDPCEVDASVFVTDVAHARDALASGRPSGAIELVSAALGRWSGPALDGIDRPWARAEAERLEAEREAAEELHLATLIALDRNVEAVIDGQRLVEERPLREHGWELLMLALYRSGRQADALRAHDRVRDILVSELGIEPGPDLGVLHRRILDQDPGLLAGEAPPERVRRKAEDDVTPAVGPGVCLPCPRSTFVGRAMELGAMNEHVRSHRLVTLVGQGGIGKTRLAIEVCGRLRDDGAGTWFVDLAPVGDGDHVAEALVGALPMVPNRGVRPLEQLTGYLRDRRARLLLDNCEHIVDGVAQVVDHVLAAAPDVSVLATSREALGVDGEFIVRLGGLGDRRSGRHAAADLFFERAVSGGGSVGGDVSTRRLVDEICELLDGVPLAIELAAARTVLLPVTEIRARLDDRLALLEVDGRRGGRRTVLATLDWSYDLLDTDEQVAFRTLSAFAAPWDLQSAAALLLCDEQEAMRLVDALVRKSLVDSAPDAPRPYRLQETIRQYAAVRLSEAGETSTVRDHHAHWLSGRLSTFLGHLSEIRWIDGVHADVLAACSWAAETDQSELLAQLCFGATSHWTIRPTYHQGRRWIDEALARPLAPSSRVAMLLSRGLLDALDVDFDSWRETAQQVADLLASEPEPDFLLAAAVAMSGYFHVVEDPQRSIRDLDACVALLPDDGPSVPEMILRGMRAHALAQAGRLDEMDVEIDIIDAWESALDDPHPRLHHVVRVCRTVRSLLSGDHDAARAVDLDPADPDSLWTVSLRVLDAIVVAHGDSSTARRRLVEIADDLGAESLVAADDLLLLGFMIARVERGDLTRARTLLDSLGAIREPALTALAEHHLARIRDLDGVELSRAVDEFRRRRLEPGWLDAVAPAQRRLLREELAAAQAV